ncbi:MAG: hypothetical protein ACXVUE_05585 [Solirubrobacteraceae bacterium]
MTSIAIAAVLMGAQVTVAANASATRSTRPTKADWQKIQAAARLRKMALARHRTVRFRTFAATLGLGLLASIHPLAPGRCLTAVIDLHNNLLDLENAFPGENWNPLRRAVAKEPSLSVCAPKPSSRLTYIR